MVEDASPAALRVAVTLNIAVLYCYTKAFFLTLMVAVATPGALREGSNSQLLRQGFFVTLMVATLVALKPSGP